MKYAASALAILECLRGTDTHPTADWIYERLREKMVISRATVYRQLASLRDKGLVVSVGTVDGFERFDANRMPHSHFICTHCQRVVDVPSLQDQLSRQLGMQVEEITLSGICPDCLEKASK